MRAFGNVKCQLKYHLLIFDSQKEFYFFTPLLIKLTKSSGYFLSHRWNPRVSVTYKHKSAMNQRLENVSAHKNRDSDPLLQEMYSLFFLLVI